MFTEFLVTLASLWRSARMKELLSLVQPFSRSLCVSLQQLI